MSGRGPVGIHHKQPRKGQHMMNYDPTERAVARLTDAYLALVDPALRVAAQRAGVADTWAAVLAGVATLTELITPPATDTGETAHPFTAATERGN